MQRYAQPCMSFRYGTAKRPSWFEQDFVHLASDGQDRPCCVFQLPCSRVHPTPVLLHAHECASALEETLSSQKTEATVRWHDQFEKLAPAILSECLLKSACQACVHALIIKRGEKSHRMNATVLVHSGMPPAAQLTRSTVQTYRLDIVEVVETSKCSSFFGDRRTSSKA